VLKHVHVLLNELISSESWEWEGGIKDFPSVDSWGWDTELTSNFDGIQVVLFIEFSWELVHLPSHLIFWNPESFFACSFLWGHGINDSIITIELDHFALIIRGVLIRFRVLGLSMLSSTHVWESLALVLGSRNNSEKEKGNIFHYFNLLLLAEYYLINKMY